MKKFKLLLLICLIPLAGIAQETPDAIKAKIKEIKLSEKYVYAETTSIQSEPEAQQNAVDLLRRNVLSLLTEKEGDPQKAEKVWDGMATSYEKLVLVADQLFRVFVYLPKESLLPIEGTKAAQIVQAEATKPALSEEDFLFEASIKEDDTKMDEATIQQFFSQMEMIESKPQKITPAVVVEQVPVQVQTPQPKQEIPVEVLPTEVKSVDMKPAEVKPIEVAPLQKELHEMLAMKSYKEVLMYLNRLKEDGQAMYGRIKTMTSPGKSYLLIVRNGEFVTILDKGGSVRTNLKTNQTEPVKNYLGYGVIWFQLY